MALTKRWAGKAWGTNIGNVFVLLEGDDNALTGVLRMNEPELGISVYSVQGSFDASLLKLIGKPQVDGEGLVFGELTVSGTMNAKGELHGDWETTIGSGGTFVLFPHVGSELPRDPVMAEQFHVARHHFGAIELDRVQIIEIAENVRQDFPVVIVTVGTGTEQARYLDDFKNFQFIADKAETLKIFATKSDGAGSNQMVSIELGPFANAAMTQGPSEAWVLGRLETLKRDLRRFERTYVTNFKRWAGQLLLLIAVVLLPSFASLTDRAIFMGGGIALIAGVNWLHTQYLPFAGIYLREREEGLLRRVGPSVTSWVFAIVATVVAALLGAYLKGWLDIPDRTALPPATQHTEAKK